MLLCLQNYDVTIKHLYGKEMLVADDISHYAPPDATPPDATPPDAPEIPLDITINQVHITIQKTTEFWVSICNNPLLSSLADTILAGWPEDINDVPYSLCPYHAHHNILKVEDGLIPCGGALTILPAERDKVPQEIHEGHLGIIKCQYNAQQCVYWPGVKLDYKFTVKTHKNQENYFSQAQLLSSHGIPLLLNSFISIDIST